MGSSGKIRTATLQAAIMMALMAITFAVRWPFRHRVGFIHDTWWYLNWSETATNRGLGQLYARGDFDYPPVYSYILLGMGHLQRDVLHAPFAMDDRTMLTLLKLPGIACDMLIVAALFLFLSRVANRAGGMIGALAYGLNPGVIYDSAIWGQVDSVAALPMVLTVICLIASRPRLAVAFLTVAVLTKFQSIVLAPLLLIALYRMGQWRAWLNGALVAAGTAVVVVLPVALVGQLDRLIDIYVESTRIQPFVSVAAFNLWWLINWLQTGTPQSPIEDSAAFIGPISYKTTALAIFGLATVGIAWATARARLVPVDTNRTSLGAEMLGLAAAGSVLAFFMLAPEMHERYVFPALPLLLLAACSWMSRLLYAGLSLTFFLNLHWVLQASNRQYWPDERITLSAGLALVNLALLGLLGVALYRRATCDASELPALSIHQAPVDSQQAPVGARSPGDSRLEASDRIG